MMEGARFNHPACASQASFYYRSRRLYVSNVGDSMCILSRNGQAVKIHGTHRVGESVDEIDRIKRAGGSVVKNR
jgi:serine/threonine protein phosphatase PrpC